MLETELSNVIAETKNPERKFNMIATVLIVSSLWAMLVLVIKTWSNDIIDENKSLKKDNSTIVQKMQNQIDSIKRVQYDDVVTQLNQIRKLTTYQDSLNKALTTIKKSIQ